jgi:hypothetical protein
VRSGFLMAAFHGRVWGGWLGIALISIVAGARAQTCQSAADMDASVRSALETTAQRYFDMAARGDTAALQQSSIPAVAASFGGIETAVKDNQSAFAGATATVRPPFLLIVDGNQALARAEFLCGVFGPNGQTGNSTVFVLNGLPPGKYGVAILDVSRGQDRRTLTLILQEIARQWRMAGFYARAAQLGGHDGAWFAQRARDFRAKGQNRNAWMYFHEAIALTAPADFVSTLATDKLYDEMQSLRPADLPVDGNTADLNAGGKIYKLTAVLPLGVGDDLDVVVKYQAADVSNTAATFKENTAVMKALLAKFPEFRDAFAGMVARALEPSGRDYGSLLPMKEIK